MKKTTSVSPQWSYQAFEGQIVVSQPHRQGRLTGITQVEKDRDFTVFIAFMILFWGIILVFTMLFYTHRAVGGQSKSTFIPIYYPMVISSPEE